MINYCILLNQIVSLSNRRFVLVAEGDRKHDLKKTKCFKILRQKHSQKEDPTIRLERATKTTLAMTR